MSLVIAWSSARTIADKAEAILQYGLFRLELDGHTTAILDLGATDETALLCEADAIVLLVDEIGSIGDDGRLKLAPSAVPLLLLSTADHSELGLTAITGHSTVLAKIDIGDLRINGCGASFTGQSDLQLRQAIRRITAMLQRPHLEDMDGVPTSLSASAQD